MSIKQLVYIEIAKKLLSAPINLQAVEMYYDQYEGELLQKNYSSFKTSAYIDIKEIALHEPQKGSRFLPKLEVEIYLNTLNSGQSLMTNPAQNLNDLVFSDWSLEQIVIKELHDKPTDSIREIVFSRSLEYQKFDQLKVKRLSFSLVTCAI